MRLTLLFSRDGDPPTPSSIHIDTETITATSQADGQKPFSLHLAEVSSVAWESGERTAPHVRVESSVGAFRFSRLEQDTSDAAEEDHESEADLTMLYRFLLSVRREEVPGKESGLKEYMIAYNNACAMAEGEGEEKSKDVKFLHRHYRNGKKQMDMWRDRKLTDVVLLSGDGEREPAHKLLLASASDYFHNMFCSDMAESNMAEVSLPFISGLTLRLVLTWLYSGDLRLTAEMAPDLLLAADHLCLEELRDTVVSEVASMLSPTCLLPVWEVAARIGQSELTRECLDTACHYAEMEDDTFLSLFRSETREAALQLLRAVPPVPFTAKVTLLTAAWHGTDRTCEKSGDDVPAAFSFDSAAELDTELDSIVARLHSRPTCADILRTIGTIDATWRKIAAGGSRFPNRNLPENVERSELLSMVFLKLHNQLFTLLHMKHNAVVIASLDVLRQFVMSAWREQFDLPGTQGAPFGSRCSPLLAHPSMARVRALTESADDCVANAAVRFALDLSFGAGAAWNQDDVSAGVRLAERLAGTDCDQMLVDLIQALPTKRTAYAEPAFRRLFALYVTLIRHESPLVRERALVTLSDLWSGATGCEMKSLVNVVTARLEHLRHVFGPVIVMMQWIVDHDMEQVLHDCGALRQLAPHYDSFKDNSKHLKQYARLLATLLTCQKSWFFEFSTDRYTSLTVAEAVLKSTLPNLADMLHRKEVSIDACLPLIALPYPSLLPGVIRTEGVVSGVCHVIRETAKDEERQNMRGELLNGLLKMFEAAQSEPSLLTVFAEEWATGDGNSALLSVRGLFQSKADRLLADISSVFVRL